MLHMQKCYVNCWHSVSCSYAAMLKNAGVISSPDTQPVAELLANPVCYVILSPHWTFRLFCPVESECDQIGTGREIGLFYVPCLIPAYLDIQVLLSSQPSTALLSKCSLLAWPPHQLPASGTEPCGEQPHRVQTPLCTLLSS